MRKIIYLLLAGITLCIASACNDGISYAERLKNQEKAINNFIKRNNLKVVEGFPANGVFDKDIYYKDTKTGIYLNILNYGDTNDMATTTYPGTLVYYRFNEGESLLENKTLYYNVAQPLSFTYGISSTYTQSSNDYSFAAYFLSYSCTLPLKYVGKGGIVNIIVPFDYGSAYQAESYDPYFLKEVRYTQFD